MEHTPGIDSLVMLIRLHQFNKEARFASPDAERLSLDIVGFEAFLGMQDGETHGLISGMRSLLTIREAAPGFPVPSSRDGVQPNLEPAGGYVISTSTTHPC